MGSNWELLKKAKEHWSGILYKAGMPWKLLALPMVWVDVLDWNLVKFVPVDALATDVARASAGLILTALDNQNTTSLLISLVCRMSQIIFKCIFFLCVFAKENLLSFNFHLKYEGTNFIKIPIQTQNFSLKGNPFETVWKVAVFWFRPATCLHVCHDILPVLKGTTFLQEIQLRSD